MEHCSLGRFYHPREPLFPRFVVLAERKNLGVGMRAMPNELAIHSATSAHKPHAYRIVIGPTELIHEAQHVPLAFESDDYVFGQRTVYQQRIHRHFFIREGRHEPITLFCNGAVMATDNFTVKCRNWKSNSAVPKANQSMLFDLFAELDIIASPFREPLEVGIGEIIH